MRTVLHRPALHRPALHRPALLAWLDARQLLRVPQGLLHRTVYVLLHNSAGLLLIQRRSPRKGVAPGRWDLTVAEHVSPGESYEAAALRGLREELRIPHVSGSASGSGASGSVPPPPPLLLLRTLAPSRRTLRVTSASGAAVVDNELVPLFEGLYDGSCTPDGDEVSAVRWLSWSALLEEVRVDAEAFTPWFVDTLRLMGRITRGA
jgi:isopentenyl-diphosphate delta-isomerase